MRSYRFIVFVLTAVLFVFIVSDLSFSATDEEVKAAIDNIKSEARQANEKLRKTEKAHEQTQKQLNNTTKKLNQAVNSGRAKDNQIANLRKKIEKLEKTKTNQEAIIQDLQAQLQNLRVRLQELEAQQTKPVPAVSSIGWHPNATCSIVAFNYHRGEPSVKLSLQYPDGGTEELEAPFKENLTGPYKGDMYFLIENLSPGTQVVLPVGRGVWTVNVDNREGYVAKIKNPSDIEHSRLDYESNKEGGGKTFKSGEAFIILKQSGMTIRPPSYTRPTR